MWGIDKIKLRVKKLGLVARNTDKATKKNFLCARKKIFLPHSSSRKTKNATDFIFRLRLFLAYPIYFQNQLRNFVLFRFVLFCF